MRGEAAVGRTVVGARRRMRVLLLGLVDVIIPLGTALFLVALVADRPPSVPSLLKAIGMVAGIAQGLALFWRRSHPRAVMAGTVLGGLVVQYIAPDGLFPYAAMVALWSLAAARPPRVSLPGLLGALAVTMLSWPTAAPGEVPFAMVVVVAVWALGEATRNRLVATEQATRRAVAVERARLARELHDVIAHSVSVMVVQAAAADDVFDTSPERARAAVRAIEAAGREAMAELRRLLAALGPAEAGHELRPAPGLDGLEGLVEPLRSLGVTVALRREEDAAVTVPAGVALSAFRIVQEAVTNIVRHAGARRVEVLVRSGLDAVELSVVDDGRGSGSGETLDLGGGRGITGMRERAAMLGGSLDAGPRPGGGFQVRARLPLAVPR